jgi:peptide/nickel transport system substrate-binding protein
LAYEEEKDDTFSFDLDEAAKLLRAANASDISTSVLLATARPELNEFMPIWQADLKTIGVDMAIQTVEIAAFSEAVNSKSYDAVYIAGSAAAGFRSPSMLFVTSPHVWSGDGNNNQVFTNARYDELVKLATEEIDPEKQKTIFSELNDIILDECHLITPASQPIRLGLAANVNGVTHHMHDGYDYSKAWLA